MQNKLYNMLSLRNKGVKNRNIYSYFYIFTKRKTANKKDKTRIFLKSNIDQ